MSGKLINLLDKIGDMVQTVFDNNRLLGFNCLSFGLGLCPYLKTFLFSCFVFGSVLKQHLEQSSCCTSIKNNSQPNDVNKSTIFSSQSWMKDEQILHNNQCKFSYIGIISIDSFMKASYSFGFRQKKVRSK